MQKRKCAGCGKINDRAVMHKITKEHSTKKLYLNPNSKIFGRSVYICKNSDCIKNAVKRKSIEKSLKCRQSEELNDIVSKLYEE